MKYTINDQEQHGWSHKWKVRHMDNDHVMARIAESEVCIDKLNPALAGNKKVSGVKTEVSADNSHDRHHWDFSTAFNPKERRLHADRIIFPDQV